MLSGTLEQELKQAVEGHREVTLITGDSRMFGGIVVESIAEGFISGLDSERGRITISDEVISGAIVHDRTPAWYKDPHAL